MSPCACFGQGAEKARLDERERAVTASQVLGRAPRNSTVPFGTSHRGETFPLMQSQTKRPTQRRVLGSRELIGCVSVVK